MCECAQLFNIYQSPFTVVRCHHHHWGTAIKRMQCLRGSCARQQLVHAPRITRHARSKHPRRPVRVQVRACNRPQLAFSCPPSHLQALAPFIPSTEAQQITEPEARDALSSYRRLDVNVPAFPHPVATAVIPPRNDDLSAPPLVCLHGFDSSSLVITSHSTPIILYQFVAHCVPSQEFRRLLPLLHDNFQAWGVDLVGWGFTACGFEDSHDALRLTLGPEEKRQHLYSFWKQHVRRVATTTCQVLYCCCCSVTGQCVVVTSCY